MPVRSAAYRVLLLDEPAPDYSQVRPKFLTSGLPFLDEASIEAITHGGFEERRLEAFRLRLHAYRRHLTWPADDAMHSQLDIIFRLLSDFARLQPAYYGTVRDELIIVNFTSGRASITWPESASNRASIARSRWRKPASSRPPIRGAGSPRRAGWRCNSTIAWRLSLIHISEPTRPY